MGLKNLGKRTVKHFFNVRAWMSYDFLVEHTQIIKNLIRDAVTMEKPGASETFEQATHRLKLKEQDLKRTAEQCLRFSLFFGLCGLIDAIACLYLLFHEHALYSAVLALVTTLLFFAQAFKYHFWFFQIKRRKLGCSLNEWRLGIMSRGDHSS